MKEEVDLYDELIDIQDKEIAEEYAKKSAFVKLLPYNKPKILILTGILSCCWNGVS